MVKYNDAMTIINIEKRQQGNDGVKTMEFHTIVALLPSVPFIATPKKVIKANFLYNLDA
jgi:hypothetical protein